MIQIGTMTTLTFRTTTRSSGRYVIALLILLSVGLIAIFQLESANAFVVRSRSIISTRPGSSSSSSLPPQDPLVQLHIFGGGGGNSNDQSKRPPTNSMTTDRRKKLGIADDEDEYDLEMALDNNTDPFITKVIAGR